MYEVVQNADGTWRVKNVPLVETGIEYPLSTGPTTFTEEQFADAVEAVSDPAIVAPRIKLGHTSGYNEELIGDAEQAFGRVDAETMALGDNNQTIYGDITGLPEWLASVMGIAYPNRSIEGNFDVETVTGRKYQLVITAVSLLGVRWPGCQVLPDLPTWYGSEIPEGIEFSDEVAADLDAAGKEVMAVNADADTSRIRRQFYDKAMSGELASELDTYWFWIRGERVADDGGLYLIAEDEDNGDLYKIPVTVNGDEIDFKEPVPVVVDYPEKAAATAVVAGMKVLDDRIVLHASRADTGGPPTTTQKGASKMDEATRKAVAAALGLPEDATEERIQAAINPGTDPESGKPASEVKPEDEPPAHQTPPGTAPTGTQGTPGEETTPPATSDSDDSDAEAGVATIDKAELARLRAGAALATKHEDERASTRRAAVISAAIAAGKFAPARRQHYTKLMAADEEGTTQMIEGLEPGLVPINERGTTGNGEEEGVQNNTAAGLPDTWFPEIGAKRAAATQPRAVTQAREA